MKEKDISSKQINILKFIYKSCQQVGYPPTVREIAEGVNLSSSATVYTHLKKLEKNNYIKRKSSKPRAIELQEKTLDLFAKDEIKPGKSLNTINVPLVGNVAAGTPILAEENIEDYIPISSDFISGNNEVFILKVRGDSMIDAGIFDRDYIIVKKQNTAINGEIVVALMEDEATVKRFFKTDKFVKLMAENKKMEPIITKNVSIIGKVIGLVRKYF